MGKHIVEFDEQCKSCGGTGLCVGMAERDGAGVVCSTCKGTGCYHFKIEYRDFEGRQKRNDVKRVFQGNPGIGIGQGRNSQHRLSDFGGMDYEEWNAGKPFPPATEMRRFTCPAWWYQGVDYEKKPSWDECIGCGSFSGCDNFKNKAACWAKWDKEYGA